MPSRAPTIEMRVTMINLLLVPHPSPCSDRDTIAPTVCRASVLSTHYAESLLRVEGTKETPSARAAGVA